jgi:hypothetical protein
MPHALAARVVGTDPWRIAGSFVETRRGKNPSVFQISRTHSSLDNSRSADRSAIRAPGRPFGGCQLRVSRENGQTG